MEIKKLRGPIAEKIILVKLSMDEIHHLDRTGGPIEEPPVGRLVDKIYRKTIETRGRLWAWEQVVEAPLETVLRIQDIMRHDTGSVKIVVNKSLRRPKARR